MDKILAITPTADRPVALKRCKYYLEQQSLLPDKWLISDSSGQASEKLTSDKFLVEHSKLPYQQNKATSFVQNVKNLCEKITDDYEYIIIFEDDDWYHTDHIDTYVNLLKNFSVVGTTKAVYYNIQYKTYHLNGNTDRASFCETAFRSWLVPQLLKSALANPNSAFVDSRFWKKMLSNTTKYDPYLIQPSVQIDRTCVGIKGMPGITGIGIGHKKLKTSNNDSDLSMLRRMLGKDAAYYEGIINDYYA